MVFLVMQPAQPLRTTFISFSLRPQLRFRAHVYKLRIILMQTARDKYISTRISNRNQR